MNRRLLALLCAYALILAACGGDDDDGPAADAAESSDIDGSEVDGSQADDEVGAADEGDDAGGSTAGGDLLPAGVTPPMPVDDPRSDDAAAIVEAFSDTGRLDHELVVKENAPLFLYLAVHGGDADLIRQSMQAAASLHGSQEGDRQVEVSEEYLEVAELWIRADTDRAVFYEAIEMAGAGVGRDAPDALADRAGETVDHVLDVVDAEDDPIERASIIHELDDSAALSTPRGIAVLTRMLGSGELVERFVALAPVDLGGTDQAGADAHFAAVIAALDDPDAEVHGRVYREFFNARSTGSGEPVRYDRDDVADLARRDLAAASPYVRGAAALHLGRYGGADDIPLLLGIVDDVENGESEVSWQRSDGVTVVQGIGLVQWDVVGAAALNGISSLTRSTSVPFEFEDPDDPDTIDAHVAEGAQAARDWWASNEATIRAELAAG